MDRRHVFVSYQRKDRFIAETIAELIEEWGYPVWLDQTSIAGGSDWQEEIREGIEKSFCIVLCVTSHLERSKWVVYEVTKASNIYIPIIPLLFVTEIPPFLAKYQGIDFVTSPKKDGCDKLRQALQDKFSEAEQGLFYLECPPLEITTILKRNQTYFIGRGANVHLQFPAHFDKISRRHVLVETFSPPTLIAYGQNPTILNGSVVKGKVNLSLEDPSTVRLAGYQDAFFILTPIKDRSPHREVDTRPLNKTPTSEMTRCLGENIKEQLEIMAGNLADPTPTNVVSTVIKGAGVKILKGAVGKERIEFTRSTIRAGKESPDFGPVEIPIKGEFSEPVLFVINQFKGEFWLTKPKTSIAVILNGEELEDGVSLKDGDIIEAAETKMQFFLYEN